jgi:hypothetical protein
MTSVAGKKRGREVWPPAGGKNVKQLEPHRTVYTRVMVSLQSMPLEPLGITILVRSQGCVLRRETLRAGRLRRSLRLWSRNSDGAAARIRGSSGVAIDTINAIGETSAGQD